MAAALHKAGLGHARGCVRLLEAGLAKLDGPDRDPSLDPFCASLRVTLDEARRWEAGDADRPEAAPVLEGWTAGFFVRRS